MWYIYISKGIPLLCFQNSKVWISALQEDKKAMAFDWRGIASIRSYSATLCLKYSKSHNSYKCCRFKKASQQALLHVMTNNPTKYEQILSYGSWQTILPNMNKFCHTMSWQTILLNMNKFCHTVSKELHSQIIMEGQMDVDYYYVTPSCSRWGTKNIISILVVRTHIQYIYIDRKYIIYLYKFRNRRKKK